MATPLRKDQPEFAEHENEQLTTADIAEGSRTETKRPGPRPVTSERNIEQGMRVDRGTTIDQGTTMDQGSSVDQSTRGAGTTPWFPSNEMDSLRARWKEIQTAFVDEPRKAVEQADGLVASAMKRLAEVFAQERSGLEQQWDRGDSVSTEDLRVAMQKYRTFFERLLSV
jgi:hypothetical protein